MESLRYPIVDIKQVKASTMIGAICIAKHDLKLWISDGETWSPIYHPDIQAPAIHPNYVNP